MYLHTRVLPSADPSSYQLSETRTECIFQRHLPATENAPSAAQFNIDNGNLRDIDTRSPQGEQKDRHSKGPYQARLEPQGPVEGFEVDVRRRRFLCRGTSLGFLPPLHAPLQ